jgi:putative hemolysin
MTAPHSSPLPPIILGDLSVKIAETEEEILEAQRLRYRVFCEEMSATPSAEQQAEERDFDAFDPLCDHLLVRQHAAGEAPPRIVGTYRLLRAERVGSAGTFYSESEFDISRLKTFPGTVMELGRSCVDTAFRSKTAMQLLWRGIGEYITHYRIELMFGCASFHGAPESHREGLSYLYHYHLAPEELRPRALPEHYVEMNLVSKEQINQKKAFFNLPVLLKGYLRLGGMIGEGAVFDRVFGTTDVCIVVRTSGVDERYVSKYAPEM